MTPHTSSRSLNVARILSSTLLLEVCVIDRKERFVVTFVLLVHRRQIRSLRVAFCHGISVKGYIDVMHSFGMQACSCI